MASEFITRKRRRTYAPKLGVLAWEEPPTYQRDGRARLDVLLAPALRQVMTRPGQWCRIADYQSQNGAHSAATTLRKRLVGKGFVFVSSRFASGSSIWCRYEEPR